MGVHRKRSTCEDFTTCVPRQGCGHAVILFAWTDPGTTTVMACAGCDLEKRQPTRLPAATPRCHDFNVVLGTDVLFVHGLDPNTEHPVLNLTCLGTLNSTFGIIDHNRRSAMLTYKAFERLWLRVFGPPEFMIMDQGTEFTGADFQS